MKFDAPRILNAPPFWKFSHLKNAWTPASASKLADVITGVRLAMGRMRSAAACICSKGISVSGMFVYYVTQRLAIGESQEILDEEFDRQLARIRQNVGAMRRDQHVL